MPRLKESNSHNDDTSWPTAAIIIALIVAVVVLVLVLASRGAW